jgi:hypothetical protein
MQDLGSRLGVLQSLIFLKEILRWALSLSHSKLALTRLFLEMMLTGA